MVPVSPVEDDSRLLRERAPGGREHLCANIPVSSEHDRAPTRRLEKVREQEPHSLFFLEAGRLAVLMGEHEVNNIAPFVLSAGHPDQFRVEFYLDHRLMQTAAFQTRLGQFIRQQPKEQVNWTALGRIDDEPLRVPDLRDQGFMFPASLLSARARAALATIVAPRNLTNWPEERI
jgi:hypothetical protein